MFTRAFDAIPDRIFLISEISGWGQLVFPAVNFACGCGGINDVHFSHHFFPTYSSDGHFSNYIVSIKYWFKIHMFAWFFLFTRSPISPVSPPLLLALTGSSLSLHIAISAHVQFVYMCLLVQLLSSVALLSCSIICICWFDVTVYISHQDRETTMSSSRLVCFFLLGYARIMCRCAYSRLRSLSHVYAAFVISLCRHNFC